MLGLWQTESDEENMFQSYTTKSSKIFALKAQIGDVLKQGRGQEVIQLSKKVAQQRAQLSVEKRSISLLGKGSDIVVWYGKWYTIVISPVPKQKPLGVNDAEAPGSNLLPLQGQNCL